MPKSNIKFQNMLLKKLPPKSAKLRHNSLLRQNSIKFGSNFTRDRKHFTQALLPRLYVFFFSIYQPDLFFTQLNLTFQMTPHDFSCASFYGSRGWNLCHMEHWYFDSQQVSLWVFPGYESLLKQSKVLWIWQQGRRSICEVFFSLFD